MRLMKYEYPESVQKKMCSAKTIFYIFCSGAAAELVALGQERLA